MKSCPRAGAALETKPTRWVHFGAFPTKGARPLTQDSTRVAVTDLCGCSKHRLRGFSAGLGQVTLHPRAFFPLCLQPYCDPPSLESTPKQDIAPAAALGTAVPAEETASSLLPRVSAGSCVLKQLPEICPFLRFCPRAKQGDPGFPHCTRHTGVCLQAQTPSCIGSGDQKHPTSNADTRLPETLSYPHFEEVMEATGFREGSDWLKQGARSCSQLIVRHYHLIRTTLTPATNSSAGPLLYKHHYKGAYKFSVQCSEQE